MKSSWTDRELSDRLRRFSTAPPDAVFEQRLSVSLGLAAQDLCASRLPPVAPAPRRFSGALARALLLGLLVALAVAAAVSASQAYLRAPAAPHVPQPGD